MDKIVDSESGTVVSESNLLDVTRTPLPELISSDSSVLANSLRRLLAELDHQEDIIAGFGNRAG